MKKPRGLSQGKKRVPTPSSSPKQTSSQQRPVGSITASGQTPKDQIQDLIDLLKRNNLTELEWECQGVRVRVRNEGSPIATFQHSSPQPPTEFQQADTGDTLPRSQPDESSGMVTITSPIVGTFYRSPSPDADPYVEEHDMVKKGQVLCIVEAMKLMNEIESEVDGKIIKILVDSTKPVEYGQPLFLIEPSPNH